MALGVFQILNVAIETQLQTLDRMNRMPLFRFFFSGKDFLRSISWKN